MASHLIRAQPRFPKRARRGENLLGVQRCKRAIRRSSKGGVSIPGQVERRLERAAAVWKRRCQGATYSTLVAEFGISKTCVHNYIEEQRALLRSETSDLAAREREQALELLDNAIEKIIPHVNGEIVIETETRHGKITVEEWQARVQACQVLVKLLDRKSKLVGMDTPVKLEPPPVVAPGLAWLGRLPTLPA